MGIPPSQYGARQISHPTAAAICVEDRNSEIRRIVVRGQNGDRYLTIGQGVTAARSDSTSQSSQSSQQYSGPPSIQPAQTVRLTDRLAIFTPSAGIYPRWPHRPPMRSKSCDRITRRLSGCGSIATEPLNRSAGAERLRPKSSCSTPWVTCRVPPGLWPRLRSTRTTDNAPQQLQSDSQTAQQMWQTVKSTGVITRDLDRQWQNAQNNLRALSNAAVR